MVPDKDTAGAVAIKLSKPVKKGDDPFRVLWQALDAVETNPFPISKPLRIQNNSNWDALAFYLVDDHSIHSSYIPAHQEQLIYYNGQKSFRLRMLSGKGWAANKHSSFYGGSPATNLKQHFFLTGGFSQLPNGLDPKLTGTSYLLQEDDFSSALRALYRIQIEGSSNSVRYSIISDGSYVQ